MSSCPSCFVDLRPEVLAYRCIATSGCKDLLDEAASAFTGFEVRARPVIVVPPGQGGATCECGSTTTQEVCPRCHYELPLGWRAVHTTCIAMAGARASGKSVYIGVLKKQAEQLATALGGALGYANDRTRVIYETYYEQHLFKDRGFMAPTGSVVSSGDAPQREPLVFSLGAINGQQRFLVIRDVAGEDLETRVANVAPFAFFRDAHATIFLFDPMMVPRIRAQLSGIVPEPTQTGADPLTVLDNVVRLIRGHDSFSVEKVPGPLAVVLAKFDTLHALKGVQGSEWVSVMSNVGAAFNRDPSLDVAAYDERDGLLLAAEVESLLVRLNAEALLNRLESTFSRHRMFAVSALGAPPSFANDINPKGIAPFRVLDPLKWAMAHSGAIAVDQG